MAVRTYTAGNSKIAFTMEVSGLEEVMAIPANWRIQSRAALLGALQTSLELTMSTLISHTPRDKGTAQAGYKPVIEANVVDTVSGKIINKVGHMGPLEYGAEFSSMPPASVLETWARRKLGVAGLGFVIARSIQEKGLPAHDIFGQTEREVTAPIHAIFDAAVDAAIQASVAAGSSSHASSLSGVFRATTFTRGGRSVFAVRESSTGRFAPKSRLGG